MTLRDIKHTLTDRLISGLHQTLISNIPPCLLFDPSHANEKVISCTVHVPKNTDYSVLILEFKDSNFAWLVILQILIILEQSFLLCSCQTLPFDFQFYEIHVCHLSHRNT